MRSAAQRIDAYNARMVSSLLDPVLTAVESQQQANFASYIADYYPFQVALRAWIDTQGISGTAVFFYEAFNNELYSTHRRFSGLAEVQMFTVLVDKYEDLGALRADLIAICLNVYGVVVV
jgi:hypothetical protein